MILLRRYQRCDIEGQRYLMLATVRKHLIHGTETMIEHTEVCRVVETARHVRIQPVGEMGPELQEAALRFAGIILEEGDQ
jgi:hypothetical protein